MIFKNQKNKSIFSKILSVLLTLVLVLGILPLDDILNSIVSAENVYNPSLGSYTEQKGILTAVPNENCGFRGWFDISGKEVSLSKKFTLPSGKTKDDYYPVFYNFNILENGDFEDYTAGTSLKDIWKSTNSLDTFTVSNSKAKSGKNSLAMALNNSTAYRVLSGFEKIPNIRSAFIIKVNAL